jgi:ketosteroid isomerase-like protein
MGMSEGDVAAVRGALEGLGESGVDGMLEWIHPEFEGVAPPGLAVEPQTYKGHEGARRWFDSFYEIMDEVRFEPSEYIDLGDGRVVVLSALVARSRGTGIEASQDLAAVLTVRDGKVFRMMVYADKQAALEAVGVEAQ